MLIPYINSNTKILIQCLEGQLFQLLYKIWIGVSRHWLVNGEAPTCGEKSLEREVRLFLEHNRISYIPKYEMLQLSKKKYDFYFEYNGVKYLL